MLILPLREALTAIWQASFLQVRLGKKHCVLCPLATIRVQNRLRGLLGDGVFFTLQPLSHRRKVDSYPVSSNLYTLDNYCYTHALITHVFQL